MNNPETIPQAVEVPDGGDGIYKPYERGGKTDKEIQDEIDKRVEDTQRTAEEIRTGGEGRSETGHAEKSIFKKKYTKTNTQWKTILKEFLQKSYVRMENPRRNEKNFIPVRQIDPRTGRERKTFVPSTIKTPKDAQLPLIIALDTSGSVTPPILNTFISEIVNIVTQMEEVKLTICLFTDHVYAEVDIDTRKEAYSYTENGEKVNGVKYFRSTKKDLPSVKAFLFNAIQYASGGTVISSVTNHLKKRQIDNINGFLVFTDGDTEQNITWPNAKKFLFFINKGGTRSILEKYGRLGPIYEIDIEHTY